MVTASHSVHVMNGLKLFCRSGTRLDETQESAIEGETNSYDRVSSQCQFSTPLNDDNSLREKYIGHIKNLSAPIRSAKLRIAVDCASGAISGLLPEVLKDSTIVIEEINNRPNGRNINVNSGSIHPESLKQSGRLADKDFGCAFDGDGDRILLFSPSGRVVRGDQMLFALARHFKKTGRLKNSAIVGTEVSSLVLERELKVLGIGLHRARVGDKNVAAMLRSNDLVLGGQPSGNLIFLDRAPSGDGIVTLVEVCRLLAEAQKSFDQTFPEFPQFHEVELVAPFHENRPLETFEKIGIAVGKAHERRGTEGRVVVRYSETEPVARITIQGSELDFVTEQARKISEEIDISLGASRRKK
jgi:phosphoglucosamine mutase